MGRAHGKAIQRAVEGGIDFLGGNFSENDMKRSVVPGAIAITSDLAWKPCLEMCAYCEVKRCVS